MLTSTARLTGLAVLLSACGGAENSNDDRDAMTVASSLERDLSPQPTAQALEALAEGNHALTVDLYDATAKAGENYMVSTLSIRTAFAMMYAGARAETADEMSIVLRFDADQPRLHEAMNALDLALQSRQLPEDTTLDLKAVELRQANAFWARIGAPWQPSYLDTLAVNYGAGILVTDFESDPESARRTINRWVEGQTEDRIKDLLPEGSLTRDTLAVLTNAIYFKAPWLRPFLATATRSGAFSRVDGTTRTADFISQIAELGYATDDGWSAVELPYRGGALSMVILVPDASTFTTFDAGLTAELIAGAVDRLEPRMVDLAVPKFEFETEFALAKTLGEMGMQSAFSDGANFTGMIEGGGLKIDDAYHKTFIAVDEQGTEAAAATGIVAVPVSAPNPDVTVRVDRPFYFLIRDRATNVWLFFGRVVDPA